MLWKKIRKVNEKAELVFPVEAEEGEEAPKDTGSFFSDAYRRLGANRIIRKLKSSSPLTAMLSKLFPSFTVTHTRAASYLAFSRSVLKNFPPRVKAKLPATLAD